MTNRNALVMVAVFFALTALYNDCGRTPFQTSSNGTLGSTINIAANLPPGAQGTSGGNPMQIFEFLRYTSPTVSSLSLCIRHIKFLKPNGITGHDIVLSGNETRALPSGTRLGFIQDLSGSYQEIDLQLDNQCGTGNSFGFNKKTGPTSIVTPNQINLKFIKNTKQAPSTQLNLELQNFVNVLSTVTDGTKIRTELESTTGTF